MKTKPTQEETIDSFEVGHNTYYLDKMTDRTFSIFKDEKLIKSGFMPNQIEDARFEFDKFRVVNSLKTGRIYWIQTGQGGAIQMELTGFNHNQTAGLFGCIPRKITSIYLTKEEAENGKY